MTPLGDALLLHNTSPTSRALSGSCFLRFCQDNGNNDDSNENSRQRASPVPPHSSSIACALRISSLPRAGGADPPPDRCIQKGCPQGRAARHPSQPEASPAPAPPLQHRPHAVAGARGQPQGPQGQARDGGVARAPDGQPASSPPQRASDLAHGLPASSPLSGGRVPTQRWAGYQPAPPRRGRPTWRAGHQPAPPRRGRAPKTPASRRPWGRPKMRQHLVWCRSP